MPILMNRREKLCAAILAQDCTRAEIILREEFVSDSDQWAEAMQRANRSVHPVLFGQMAQAMMLPVAGAVPGDTLGGDHMPTEAEVAGGKAA